MKTSEQINELAGALAKAQGAMTAALKDAKNPHLGNNYADLASVWNACRQPLSANDLAVVQIPENVVVKSRQYIEMKKFNKNNNQSYTQTTEVIDATITITTRLLHSSGQWIESELEMPVLQMDPQSVGSVITYGRRYSLAAIVGITQDDDDGNAGGKPGQQQKNEQAGTQPTQKTTAKPSAQQQKPAATTPKPSTKAPETSVKTTEPSTKPATETTKTVEPSAEGNGYINAVLLAAKHLNMTNDDLKFATKETVGSDTLKNLDPATYKKLLIFLNGLADDGITWEQWKTDRLAADAALAAAIPDIPAFPAI